MSALSDRILDYRNTEIGYRHQHDRGDAYSTFVPPAKDLCGRGAPTSRDARLRIDARSRAAIKF